MVEVVVVVVEASGVDVDGKIWREGERNYIYEKHSFQ